MVGVREDVGRAREELDQLGGVGEVGLGVAAIVEAAHGQAVGARVVLDDALLALGRGAEEVREDVGLAREAAAEDARPLLRREHERGVEDDLGLAAGDLVDELCGAVLAHGEVRDALPARAQGVPAVEGDLVDADARGVGEQALGGDVHAEADVEVVRGEPGAVPDLVGAYDHVVVVAPAAQREATRGRHRGQVVRHVALGEAAEADAAALLEVVGVLGREELADALALLGAALLLGGVDLVAEQRADGGDLAVGGEHLREGVVLQAVAVVVVVVDGEDEVVHGAPPGAFWRAFGRDFGRGYSTHYISSRARAAEARSSRPSRGA